MLKKNSGGSSNTLLNYFSKSPSVAEKKSTKTSVESNRDRQETPTRNGKQSKKSHNDDNADKNVATPTNKKNSECLNLDLEESTTKIIENVAMEEDLPIIKRPHNEDSSDEDLETNKKKRRRVFTIQSDSENENESEEDPEDRIIKNKLNNFEKKLQDLKQESISYVTPVKQDVVEDTVVWKHHTLNFLKPENIKDKKGLRPDDPNYDPSTLYVSESFLNSLTPGVRQWWEFKSQYFDCVLFFKVGKFYELYHMDADITVQELGFSYMRGDFAHTGFPEISYDKMATQLIDKGYKVARVEQTETPDMMAERCKKQIKTTKFDKVVRREICQITTKGSKVFGPQSDVTLKHTSNYMLSIVEKKLENVNTFGICFVDTSIGDFYFGQFEDDKNCSRFLTLISHYPPVLVLYEKNALSNNTNQTLKTVFSGVLKESLKEFQSWDAEKTLKHLLKQTKNDQKQFPINLKIVQDENDHLGLTPNDSYKLALKAIGQCLCYLKKCFLDEQVLNTSHFKLYIPPDINYKSNSLNKVVEKMKKQHMVLDSITLANLRIIDTNYSLIISLDFCKTTFGKRLLQRWVCSPSCDVSEIHERQLGIAELIENQDVLQQLQSLFSTLPDFERYLAQINVFGNGKRLENHPDGRAIFFEQKIYNKKKIQSFIKIINGFESLLNIPQICQKLESRLLKNLSQVHPVGSFPDLYDNINFFKKAFNHEEALADGVIAPKRGVDAEYDSIENSIDDLKKELKIYLEKQEKIFNCRLNYFGNDKKRYQLEVPEKKAQKAGKDYVLEGQRKGSNPVRRFHTPQTKDFLKRMMQLEEKRNNVLGDLSRRIYEKFSNHYEIWKNCIDSVATLDVLASLAEYAKNQTEICVPEIQESADEPFINIVEGYHPCLTSENYIPNGISLGGCDEAPLILLTGPNMGGKSTLMRQIGLLVIMAQIGSHIPARSCKMTIFDRIFTRLGANDDILAGQSTFLVELNETASILKHATKNSLVLLDELGRGTATYDGTAIAAAVVNNLTNLSCLTIFSTHYHNLVDYFHKDPRINLGHMACMVEKDEGNDPTEETVTFLYKYANGACPKSYGFNAAKLAGMPQPVIKRAYKLSKAVEAATLKRKIISKIVCGGDILQIKNLLLILKSCKI